MQSGTSCQGAMIAKQTGQHGIVIPNYMDAFAYQYQMTAECGPHFFRYR